MTHTETKRLFFAFEVEAPWPSPLPEGRLLQEKSRHLTLSFLGSANFTKLRPLLTSVPLPSFKVGVTGWFDQVQFLPKRHPRVAAWHVCLFGEEVAAHGNPFLQGINPLADYSHTLLSWLNEQGECLDDKKGFLPHVTLCRAPFDFEGWHKAFQILPLAFRHLHLYESLGQLDYQPVWTHSLLAPFEELDHTADIAYKIRGESISQLFYNAFTALAFKFPELLRYNNTSAILSTIDEVVIQLNHRIAQADCAVGCPFKAVSFHGEIEKESNGTLTWEMIVDV